MAAAIREDLGKVKDVLDIYQRRGGSAPEELAPQLELLRKIGDTNTLPDRPEIRGMIARIPHLVEVSETTEA